MDVLPGRPCADQEGSVKSVHKIRNTVVWLYCWSALSSCKAAFQKFKHCK